MLYYSACKKATAMVFITGDRVYPDVCFEYKTASEQNIFGCFKKKLRVSILSKETPKTVFCILYWKWTAGYPLSPHSRPLL